MPDDTFASEARESTPDAAPIAFPALQRADQGEQVPEPKRALVSFDEGADRYGLNSKQVADRYRRYEDWLRRHNKEVPPSEMRMVERGGGPKSTRFVPLDALEEAIARSAQTQKQTAVKPAKAVQVPEANIDKIAEQGADQREDASALISELKDAHQAALEREQMCAQEIAQEKDATIAAIRSELDTANRTIVHERGQVREANERTKAEKDRADRAEAEARKQSAEIERLRNLPLLQKIALLFRGR